MKTYSTSTGQSLQLQTGAGTTIADTSAATAALQRHQQTANNSNQAMQLQQRADMMASASSIASTRAVQWQRQDIAAPRAATAVQREERSGNAGLPDPLKSGIESLAGMRMDHVAVHYNSDKPAQLQAHAYAQGSAIHLAPGQEQHLPHEAWHVVQQAQGRVQPTMQLQDGVAVNDDGGLEREADLMGARALADERLRRAPALSSMPVQRATGVVQRVWDRDTANAFVNANAPAAGETPAAWKARIQALLNATDYVNGTDANTLANAFKRYHQRHHFTAAHATAFVAGTPPIAGQNEAAYKLLHQGALANLHYIESISHSFLKASFEAYHQSHIFTAANASAIVTAHPPVRPQIFSAYALLHNAVLVAAGYDPQISNGVLSDAYDAYWVAHPFDAAAVSAYFGAHPPPHAPQTAAAYVIVHRDDLDTNWHAFAALFDPAIVALFNIDMAAFRATQTANETTVTGYYTALDQPAKDHIFLGGFNNNGPKGMHAYTNGNLPAGCQIHQTIGGPAGVHVIIWSNALSRGVNKCKWSSMFPNDYLQGMVAWHVLHDRAPQNYLPAARPTVGLPPWQNITVGTAGNTAYPVMNNIASTNDVQGMAGGTVTSQLQNRKPQYSWNGAGISYVIDN